MLVVTCRVAGSAYALRASDVVSVIPEVELRPLAQGAAWLRGVFAHRGELTPVVDVCQLVGGYRCPARLSSRIALVRSEVPGVGTRLIGLLAEHMTEARRLQDGLPAAVPALAVPYFGEVRLEGGEPLQFLEPAAILHTTGLALSPLSSPSRITAGEEDREPSKP